MAKRQGNCLNPNPVKNPVLLAAERFYQSLPASVPGFIPAFPASSSSPNICLLLTGLKKNHPAGTDFQKLSYIGSPKGDLNPKTGAYAEKPYE